MKYKAILCLFIAQIFLTTSFGAKIDYMSLKLNKLVENDNSNGIKYYKINLNEMDVNNQDLVIESKIVDSQNHKTPLVVMSLFDFSNDNAESKSFTWVCNQVTEEHCFIPSKYLTKNTVYVSTYCNECSYNLKYYFENKTPIVLGESKMIHLKSNDKKSFSFKVKSINDFNEYLNFSAFNHKKTDYKMEVTAITKNNKLSLPVINDWKEGKQSMFKSSDLGKSSILDMEFVLDITAIKPSFISVEVGSGNTIINLSDEKFRIDSVSLGTHNCYKYNSNNNDKLIAHVKSIEGNLKLHISEKNYSIESGKDEVIEYNNELNEENLVCVESEKSAYYTINIYHNQNSEKVKKINNLLLSKSILI